MVNELPGSSVIPRNSAQIRLSPSNSSPALVLLHLPTFRRDGTSAGYLAEEANRMLPARPSQAPK
eukprot:2258173-Pyramimonas_sp.AAC.1